MNKIKNKIVWDKLSENDKDRTLFMRKNSSVYREECILSVPTNCKEYGMLSHTRLQLGNYEVMHVLEGRDPLNNSQPFEIKWKRLTRDDVFGKIKNNEYAPQYTDLDLVKADAKGELGYFLDEVRGVRMDTDFYEIAGRIIGNNQPRLDAFWEQIQKDMMINTEYETKPDENINEAWRAEELKKYIEYGENGEKAAAYFESLDDAEQPIICNLCGEFTGIGNVFKEHILKNHLDYIQKNGIAESGITPESLPVEVLTSDEYLDHNWTSATERLNGIRKKAIVSYVDQLGEQSKGVLRAFEICTFCFNGGTKGRDDKWKSFLVPSVKPEDIRWYITSSEICGNCGRKNTLKIHMTKVPIIPLKLADSRDSPKLNVLGCRDFDVRKGDLVAVDVVENATGLWCIRIQILQRRNSQSVGSIGQVQVPTLTGTSGTLQALPLPEHTNIEDKILIYL